MIKLPEIPKTDDQALSVYYLHMYLAIKELSREVDLLKARVAELEAA